MDANIDMCLLGRSLYGDNFSELDIRKWYQDEAEGYANLGAEDADKYEYQYHALNMMHGFRHLPKQSYGHIISIGGAYGDELRPVLDRAEFITVLEPSEKLAKRTRIENVPCNYVKPCPSGDIPIEQDAVDLITCHGVLHHIPNVSHVIGECHRILKPGGKMLLREPIVSMGDWRKPRAGLTKRERGIPEQILDDILRANGFKCIRRAYCVFSPITAILTKIGVAPFKNRLACSIDAIFSRVFSFNTIYHRVSFGDKIAPASIYYVLEK